MSIIETIHQHRSIRKYKPDSVPDETLNEILTAGIRASSFRQYADLFHRGDSRAEIKRAALQSPL